MKQILFLLLFPCFAIAQYQGNGNQKITLGEQTTADGLVWRGIRADTTTKIVPLSDTSAYIILDTVEKTLWLYKAGQIPKWQQVGGSTLDTATMLLPYYRAGRNTIIQAADVPILNQNTTGSAATLTTGRTIQTNLASTSTATFNGSANITPGVTGTLPVANGGTNTSSFTAGSVVFAGASGTSLTQDNSNLFWNNTTKRLGLGTSSPQNILHIRETDSTGIMRLGGGNGPGNARIFIQARPADSYIDVYGNNQYLSLTLNASPFIFAQGNVGIGTSSPLSKLNVMGTVRINSASAPDANYYLQLENSSSQKAKAFSWDTYSDSRIKTEIQPIFNAIDKVNLLNPVYYQKHDSYVENDFLNIDYDNSVKSLGFIAQEVYNVIPEAVNTGTTNELWAMDYTKIIPILTKAIQEQQTLIKALEQRIINLENK